MPESSNQNFNHLKIHSQYSICEGAVKLDNLQDFSKSNKIKSLALCDTSNLCGALEFAEKISKVGTQPIIGTQINFKFGDTVGLLRLFSLIPKILLNLIFKPFNESFFKRSSAFPPFSELIFGKIGFENSGLKLHRKGKL